MRSNPFYTREVARWSTPEARSWLVLYPMVLVFLPLVVYGYLHPLLGLPDAYEVGLIGSALTWLGLLTLGAVVLGASAWPRERQMETLPIVTLAAYPAERQVWGRWLAGMRALAPTWGMGFFLLFLAAGRVAGEPTCNYPIDTLFFEILFVAVWCGTWLAFGLLCSLGATNVLQALMSVVGHMFVMLLGWTMLAGFLSSVGSTHVFLCGVSMPLSPFAPWFLLRGSPPAYVVAVFCAWSVATVVLVKMCGERLAEDAPLHAREPQLLTVLRRLVPMGRPAGLVAVPQVRLERVLHRGWIDVLLAPFHRNPFYAAYRDGFGRIYEHVEAMPGSAWPTGFMYWGLITFCMFQWARLPDIAVWWLLSGVVPGACLSALEAFSLGWQSLSIERDRATWPLLLVSGMDGRVILGGKFAAAFYAISGEWMATCPAWFLTLVTPAPFAILMMFVQPLLIALGILCGLIAASTPFRGQSTVLSARWVVAGVVTCVVGISLPLPFGGEIGRLVPHLAFDPFLVVWQLSRASAVPALEQMLGGAWRITALYGVGLAVLGGLFVIARGCVNRLLNRAA